MTDCQLNLSDNVEQNHFNPYNDSLQIIKDKDTMTHTELENKWDYFKKQYPMLFKMLTTTENIDLTLLKFLCDTAEKQNKLTSNDDKLNNEFKVGDKLAKSYIYDKFDKFEEPSARQKEHIKNVIREKLEKGETIMKTKN